MTIIDRETNRNKYSEKQTYKLENKIGDFGQNQCHRTGVKKLYF